MSFHPVGGRRPFPHPLALMSVSNRHRSSFVIKHGFPTGNIHTIRPEMAHILIRVVGKDRRGAKIAQVDAIRRCDAQAVRFAVSGGR